MIARQGSGARETFTVRKQSFGVGVERTFPVHSPKIEQLEVVARGDVRRAKLYYLRGRVGKRARVAERRWGIEDDLVIAAGRRAGRGRLRGRRPGGGRAGAVAPRARRPSGRRRGRRRRRSEAGERPRRADEPGAGRARGRGSLGIRRRGRGFRGIQLIPKPTTGRGAVVELVVIVALAIGLALGIQAFVVKPYQIPSESMEPTLDVGQRVLVNRVSTRLGGDPKPGDVVVFHPPEGAVNGTQLRRPEGRRAAPCPTRDAREGRRELHQAGRRRARRHALDRGRDPDRQRRAVRGRLGNSPMSRDRRLRFPEGDHHPARLTTS